MDFKQTVVPKLHQNSFKMFDMPFHEKGNNIVGMCAGFKIKINGCIPDYEDNCYRLDFSGVTIPCLVPMANLHPLSVRMN